VGGFGSHVWVSPANNIATQATIDFFIGFSDSAGLGFGGFDVRDGSPKWDVRNACGGEEGLGLLLSTLKFGPRVSVGSTDAAPIEAQFDQETLFFLRSNMG